MIKYEIDFTPIKETLNGINRTQVWKNIATQVFSKIIRNIQSGFDVNGKPFKDYSVSYKKTRTRKNLGLRVNLQNTSIMIRALTITASEEGFVIFFVGRDQQKKAEYNQLKNGRVFLDWGRDTIAEFKKALSKFVKF